MTNERLFFNGINASRGTYGRQPLTVDQLAAMIRGDGPLPSKIDPDSDQVAELKARADAIREGDFLLKEGVEGQDLAQTGWGVIFAANDPQAAAIREALGELLAWRKAQAGLRYRESIGASGYQPQERKADFLRRQGAATSGPVDPDLFPYYLLIVGDPEAIPYRFQYQLDVQYAVGRIYFDTLDEYARYARSVVTAERGEVKLARRAVFFGVRNPDDLATARAADQLVRPLAEAFQQHPRAKDWSVDLVLGEGAHKNRLRQLLGGNETPAFLFAASHGLEFDHSDPQQIEHQGALLCQDWTGPRLWRGPIPQEFYFAGEDLDAQARLLGTIAFSFACFGAGTPRYDDFAHQKGQRAEIAPHAFIARLPQRMLAHPNGGALAVVGHVERAWTFSFSDVRGQKQIETFNSAMRKMMIDGAPVGLALDYFNNRYAELAAVLTGDLEDLHWEPGKIDPLDLSTRWTEHNDARSYVIIGDPAVRLPLADLGGEAVTGERSTIPQVSAPTQAAAVPPTAPALPGFEPILTPPAVGASFGLFGSGEKGNETLQKLTTSLQTFAERLGENLKQAIEDASYLEITTYVADDLAQVNYHEGDFSGAQIRAVTRMALDGDTQVVVPRREGQIDEELWNIHLSMVQQAQINRATMIQAIANAAAALMAALK